MIKSICIGNRIPAEQLTQSHRAVGYTLLGAIGHEGLQRRLVAGDALGPHQVDVAPRQLMAHEQAAKMKQPAAEQAPRGRAS